MASASSSQELHHMPLIMAVKYSTLSQSSSLQREKEILTQLQGCPQILRCFGDDLTVENGNTVYNLFLEYVSGGTLADRVKDFGGRLPEPDVRRYTRSMLQCLNYIHGKGYVHCDIKLPNILVSVDDESVKISDFGLAKRVGIKEDEFCLRGTPLYMSPESIARSEYEPPSDIWSLGCIVAEMVAGKPAWRCRADADVGALLFRIGFGSELPEIPSELSEQGKDFLSQCFVRDPTKRWTAEALLNHPFVADETVRREAVAEEKFLSPRSAFDFPQWGSLQSSSPSLCSSPSSPMCIISSSNSPCDRIQRLATEQKPNWSTGKDDWITAREAESSVLVSERSDSLLVLEEMLMRTENREENFTRSTSSSIGASISFFPVQLSDSGSGTDQEEA